MAPTEQKAEFVGSRDRKDKTPDREFLPSGGDWQLAGRSESARPDRMGARDSTKTLVFLKAKAQFHFRCRMSFFGINVVYDRTVIHE